MAFDSGPFFADIVSAPRRQPRLSWRHPVFGINGPVKRVFDILVSALAIAFTLPLLLTIAIIVRSGGGPAFFRQQRIGRGGRLFHMYKFRTMHPDAEARLEEILSRDAVAASEWAEYQKLSNDPRITRFGRFLRKSSLDELPQLFNVLLGSMSIVGQRPILPSQAEAYGSQLATYTAARPGITGLWQVAGRNRTSFQRRVELGSVYLSRWSLLFDLRIIMLTVPALVAGQTS